uniref:Ubiquitin carboxyl-terminal hydrolase 17-like protein B n=1 Tax=Petromyzon marinus TaxID=7757 RepID=A0AAJ7X8V9_PETMA|nr:ubiquitin carboxyl-terminal hydrolase 17-like protein B [Petromyzon marinus]
MSLHHLPNVLALSIKRYDLFGNKINRICDGRWFRMDDDLVTPVDTRVVMEKQAYILFYIRSPEMKAIPVCSQINGGHGKWHQKRRQRQPLTPAINRHH